MDDGTMTKTAISRRVRALLRCENRGFVLIERHREGEEKYCVFPGGGIDEGDADAESALRRELKEELNVRASGLRYVGTVRKQDGDAVSEQDFFYATCDEVPNRFTGFESSEAGRGTYKVVFVLQERDLAGRRVLPIEALSWLKQELRASTQDTQI
jgi:8-oxo-dGTP pyrophosphatase MutT (NUDIX family)